MMCNNPLDNIEDVDEDADLEDADEYADLEDADEYADLEDADEYADLEDADEFGDLNIPEIPADLPDPLAVLQSYREPAPRWLGPVTRFTRATFKQFLHGQVAFYPNAGKDGALFPLFAKSHSVHCFVHADLDHDARGILSILQEDSGDRLYGYDPVFDKIIPSNWWQPFDEPPGRDKPAWLDTSLFVVLRRRYEFSDDHGPEYLCFLHVLADACWLYWNLWGRHDQAPFAMLLQRDMTWREDDIEALLNVANEAGFPEFLLVDKGQRCWPGYQVVSDLSEPSGMNRRKRRLYRRTEIH
jgi:hypothetical protein